MATESNNPPLVAVVGETASGKSALAVGLARQFNGEVICADSWTVYKDFNIGTAKPNIEERALIPHHLLDVADPREGFSAVEFKRLANLAIEDIAGRGKLPILVGGTGLYIDSVLFDYSFLPPASKDMRSRLSGLSLAELLAEVERFGLDTEGIDLRNKRRVVRLIENNGVRPTRASMRQNSLIIGLRIDRDLLRTRVVDRVDQMLTAGLEAEVRHLKDVYGWGVEPMKGIGYREFYEYFEGSQNLEETRNKIISSTLNLAKRQRTWFKRNEGIHWVSEQAEAVELVTTFLNK